MKRFLLAYYLTYKIRLFSIKKQAAFFRVKIISQLSGHIMNGTSNIHFEQTGTQSIRFKAPYINYIFMKL
jgi:hypothetical protein